MITIEATVPCASPPCWALWERRLIDLMNASAEPFLTKYTRDDGSLIWHDSPRGTDVDDFYESFYNWPLLYVLGGGDHLLSLGLREWDALTQQLTRIGKVYKGYERHGDQFHQAEGYLFFYLLCLADPANAHLCEQAQRFAGLYMNEDPEAPNYDPAHRIITAPLNGSGGPHAWGGENPSYGYSPGMARYGLPYEDVPGVRTIEDLKDPGLARRMGQVMQERMSRGDVVGNLAATTLATNAFLMTAEDKYRRWALEYTDAWMARARANGGLLPDNVGLSGRVGEYINGKWYGGLYGWTWPHGYYNVAMAAIVAAQNALLLTRDPSYLDLPRWQMDRIHALGARRRIADLVMSLEHHWTGMVNDPAAEAFVVPYRYADSGWFDWQPPSPIYPTAVWNASLAEADWERIERLRAQSAYDWDRVVTFRGKEDAGHEEPWLRFLAGHNPSYPERILQAAYGIVCRRLQQICEDTKNLAAGETHVHHWQQLNPVTTETLVQLTLGAPQLIYNGGLLMAPLRYHDAARRRPGLPADIAALVTRRNARGIALTLVNLSAFEARDVLLQAGALGEHRFLAARFSRRTSPFPGEVGSYAAPALETCAEELPIDDGCVRVHLPPASEIGLELDMARYVREPSYRQPW